MKFYTFLLTLAAILTVGGTDALAAKVEYDCPDLHDEKKRTIEPLNQGYDGWFFRNNDLKMDFSISPEAASYIKRLNSALAEQDIQLVILPLLSRAIMANSEVNYNDPWQENYDLDFAKSSYKEFVATLKGTGAGVVDLSVLYPTYERSNPYNFNFKRDIHWKPEGAKVVAEVAADFLKKLDKYDALPKTQTSSKKQEEVGRAGTIREEIQRLCRGEIEPETFTSYKATRKSTGGADDLFGDSAAVPVSLIGTSFSAVDEFNFLAFMEEFSKLEIVNFSIAGGEMSASLLSYLSSPYFLEHLPSVILWETQAVYDFNKGTEYVFRQAIPAVEGSCSGENVITTNRASVSSSGAASTLLRGLEGKEVSGADYYLHIKSSNPNFRKFNLEMEYDDQDGELFPIERDERFENKGHFYIELSDQIAGNLSSVVMKDSSVNSGIDIKLCRKTRHDKKQTDDNRKEQ